MSWYRQIKILYTVSSNTFFFIIYGSILNGILGGKVHYELFLLSLFSAFILAYMLDKANKPAISAFSAFIISEAILFLISNKSNLLYGSIYICFILFITYMSEQQDVNYEVYKNKAKQAIAILVVLGFICTFSMLSTQQFLLKFYLIFLISTSILMREARNYYYSLKNNKSFITNIAIAVLVIFFSLDSVFNRVLICLGFLENAIYKGIEWLTDVLVILINKPLEIMINYLKISFSNKLNSTNKIYINQYNPQLKNDEVLSTPAWTIWLSNIIKVILLLAIIYLAYKSLCRLRRRKSKNYKEISLDREKLSKDKNYNTYSIKRILKNILNISNSREQAINVYKKFEQKTNEKGIFREHMTAKQLENITKAYIERPEGINNLTDIYNEAKFSSHKISKEKVEEIKESFAKVKNQL
ncbi:hypothetical protein [Candidatus Clostridium stratigraminis]|uniref:DUF4129 domain-containing protein n=1 Tax=Candidatus Clostridium stratigraminis TaxID=3381661 RepID=A0ABW8T6D6_9CLOT